MKLAYPIATPDSHGKVMGFSGNFEKNLESIKEIGYDGVELLVRDPNAMNTDIVMQQVNNQGLAVVSVGTSPVLDQEQLTLMNKDKTIRDAALVRAKESLEFAGSFGVGISIGRFRNNVDSEDKDNNMDTLNRTIAELCDHGEKCGGQVWLEPQNSNNVNNLNTIDESLAWIDQMDKGNLGLLLDTFHMDITEVSITSSIIKAKTRTSFIHISDRKRMVPGVAGINFTEVLAAFAHTGYDGYLSMEFKQIPDSYVVAKLSYDYLRYLNEVTLNHII